MNTGKRVLVAAGSCALLLGVAGIASGVLRALALVHAPALLRLMASNVSFALLVVGASLIERARGRLPGSHALARGVVLCGLVVVGRHASGWDVGGDDLLFHSHVLRVSGAYTGGVFPIAAACFGLSGTAMLLLTLRTAGRWCLSTAGLLSMATIALSSVASFGYVIGTPALYGTGWSAPISASAAAGFVIVGLGISLGVWLQSRADSAVASRWVAAMAALGIAMATGALWQALVVQEQTETTRIVDAAVSNVEDSLRSLITTDTRALERVAARWKRDDRPLRRFWEGDAGRLVHDSAALSEIEWIDSARQPRWAMPSERDETFHGRNLRFDPRRRAALDSAMNRERLVVSRPIDLAQGGKGFLIYVPVSRRGRSDGLIAGVISFDKLLIPLTHTLDEGFRLTISEGGEEICRLGNERAETNSTWGRERYLNLGDVIWRLRLMPTRTGLVAHRSALPPVVLVFGLLSAILVGSLLAFWQAAQAAQRHAEEQAARRTAIEAQLAEAQCIAQLGSAEMDLVSGQILCSQELLRLFEFDGAGDLQPSFADLMARYHPDDVAKRQMLFAKALADGEPYEFEVRTVTKDGSLRWLQVKNRLVRDSRGRAIRLISTFRDITRERQLQTALTEANDRLQALATIDGLTGLYNRRGLQGFLTQEFVRWVRYIQSSLFSLVFVDIDEFKQYNDTFGHLAGDDALKQIGRLLRGNARGSDVVARYGGEEFILLMPNTDAAGAMVSAERIRKAIEAAEWAHRPVTASFGVSTATSTTETPAVLIAEADAALYVAKRSGRNRVVHFVTSGARVAAGVVQPEATEID